MNKYVDLEYAFNSLVFTMVKNTFIMQLYYAIILCNSCLSLFIVTVELRVSSRSVVVITSA